MAGHLLSFNFGAITLTSPVVSVCFVSGPTVSGLKKVPFLSRCWQEAMCHDGGPLRKRALSGLPRFIDLCLFTGGNK